MYRYLKRRRNYYIKKRSKNILSFLFSQKGITIGTFIIGIATFVFLIYTYHSPASIESELVLIQRPDSLYQGQIYIWNSGDETAKDIIIRAKYNNVYISNTKKKIKLRQYLWTHFSVESYIMPIQILNHLGEKTFYYDYKLIIKNLPSCEKRLNYFIVTPEFIQKKYLNLPEYNLYRQKFYQLKNLKGIPSYIDEILNSVKIIWEGKYIKPKLAGIIKYNKKISIRRDFYFPKIKDLPNRNNTSSPELFLPPFIIKRKRSGGWSGWARW